MSAGNIFSTLLHQADDLSVRLAKEARDVEEQELISTLLSEVRRYCAKHVDSADIDARGKLGAEVLDGVAEQGWFGLTVPERFGGAGLSLKAATRVVSELARFNCSLGTCVGLHSGLALYGLIHLAGSGLQERYLPEIALGRRIAAFAATEPNAGSDIASMRSTLSESPNGLRLNGSKCYVTNGGLCGVLTVVARSPGLGGAKAGHTMVLVDPSWKGVSRQREEKKLGLKGSSTISIDFEDVHIPADHVVGEPSKGMEYAHKALTWGRTFMAAGCIGVAQAGLEEARAHTSQRTQFGRTLDSFPLVKHQTSTSLAKLYAMESVVRAVCDLFEVKQGDIGLDSAVAKVLASESSWSIVDRCLQLMGGTGYIEEAGMARRLRDLRVSRIFEGANDVLRMHIASAILNWKQEGLCLPPLAPHLSPTLQSTGLAFDQRLAELTAHISQIRMRYGFRLYERQVLQSSLADAIIDVYAMIPVLLRASRSENPRDQALAQLACARLLERSKIAADRMELANADSRADWMSVILES